MLRNVYMTAVRSTKPSHCILTPSQSLSSSRRAFSHTTTSSSASHEIALNKTITPAPPVTLTTTPTATTTTSSTNNTTIITNNTPQPDDLTPLPPQWKNPVGMFLDFIFAGGVTYGAIKIFDFITYNPEVVDIMFNQAIESPFLAENLGQPLKRSGLWWGNVEDYYARVDMTVCGPSGCGDVHGKAFRVYDASKNVDRWEMVYLYGALPQFDNRLTDLLPLDENEVNMMPYIPAHDDPSAAPALSGAPVLPYTSVQQHQPPPPLPQQHHHHHQQQQQQH